MADVIAYSLEAKEGKLRAVHYRTGPVGRFITTALSFQATILGIDFYETNTVRIKIEIDEACIDEFHAVCGFGLKKEYHIV